MEISRDTLLVLLSEVAQVSVNEGCSRGYMGLNNDRKLIQLRDRLDKEYGIFIGIRELEHFETAGKLIQFIQNKAAEKSEVSIRSDTNSIRPVTNEISAAGLEELERKLCRLQKDISPLISRIENSGSHIGELEGNFFGHVSSEKIREQLTHLNNETSSSLKDVAQLVRSMNENQQLSTRMIKGLLILQMKAYDLINSSTEVGKKAYQDILNLSKNLNLTDSDLNKLIQFIYRKEADQKKHFNDIEQLVQEEVSEMRGALQQYKEEMEALRQKIDKIESKQKTMNSQEINEITEAALYNKEDEKNNSELSLVWKIAIAGIGCLSVINLFMMLF